MLERTIQNEGLDILVHSDLHLHIPYDPKIVQVAYRRFRKKEEIHYQWYIAPIKGERLEFSFLRDLHKQYQVLSLGQKNGETIVMMTDENRFRIFQTSFGLPNLLFSSFALSVSPYQKIRTK